MRRHSKGMMVGGIVMVSVAPLALIASGLAALGKSVCNIDNGYERDCNDADGFIYGSLLTGVALVGVGIPLIVIGAAKEPVEPGATARIAPWATPHAAGIGLQLEM
jgi:hypothetical protein